VFGFLTEFSAAMDQDGGRAFRASALGEVAGTSIALETVRNRRLTSERISAQQTALSSIALDRPVRVGGLIIPIHFDLRAIETRGDRSLQAQSRVAIATRQVSVSAALGWRRVTPRDGAGRSAATGAILLNGRVGTTRIRGGLDWEIVPLARLMGAVLSANKPLGTRGDAQATIGYAGGENYAYAAAGYTRDLGFASVTSNIQADTRGALSLRLGFGFSFGGNGRGRFGRIASTPRASTGNLEVSAYQDLNGDGARQSNEPAIPVPGLLVNDVPISTCRKRELTCRAIAEINGVEPFVPVRIAIDESSIADPFQVPNSVGMAAVPRSGLVNPVELGIMGTATIEGTLALGGTPTPARMIELIDEKGAVAYRVRTEFDGFFTLERVRYGRYRLRLENTAEIIGRSVTVSAEQNSVRLGTIGK
ncbi:carboxypeptidase regulatory-like domain-containing protein, partial [Sphingomonas sp. ZT3P38]